MQFPASQQNIIRVYDFFFQHLRHHGYAPTNTAAAQSLELSVGTVSQAVARLAELKLITYVPRRWCSVRIVRRDCQDCGCAITLHNAVGVFVRPGDFYIRNQCADCRRKAIYQSQKQWEAANPGHNKRRTRKSYRQRHNLPLTR